MKKKVFKIITSAIMLIAPIGLMAQHLEYKGIPIDGKIEKFVEKLEQSFGYKTYNKSMGYEYSMSGIEQNCDFTIYVRSSPLSKTTYNIQLVSSELTEWNRVKSLYETICKEISKKYYLESKTEKFVSPYKDGDGFEIQAFNLDKAIYESFFKNKYGRVTVFIRKSFSSEKALAISVSYIDNANEIIDEKEEDSFRF